ncbi:MULTISPECIES: MATE family efflux transporter [unclassified Desulfovibrio]|uniref:MATE family efflux transporter n=1 Tax=unclassified Desulfovibrio TaxID=2593640 RepID=UPI000F5E94AA|nr:MULTISPECIES: MATE family efflux transporter [unclassified Desulfovibrio]RRD70541.1 MATE family efflux transporter [Desulfovibrio sp. OH1209_COT-279]RRD86990.1 MATE family efflux transporter [Desulfovibrio sp. OH1186_COT-070]
MTAKFFSWSEARRFYAIGLPIFIAQMAQMGMSFADTAMTGQFSAEAMAAVAVASSVWAPVLMLGIGCLLALPPLSAQLVGGGRAEGAAHLLRQGIWVTLGVSLLLVAVLHGISRKLEVFGLTPELAHLAGGYLRAIMWGMPGFMLFINMRSFLEGFSHTRPAMGIALLGLALNVPCNYILIYGKLGLEPMGAVGCGVASALCYWFMAACMFWHLRRAPHYVPLRPLFAPMLRPGIFRSRKAEPWLDGRLILRILRLGLPAALALCFEVSLFALSGILLAPLGTVTVAGHQVALNVASLIFVIPLSIGMTATIRVGRCLGARQVERARLVARTALGLSVGSGIIIALLTLLFRHAIVRIYTHDADVMALAAHLLCYQAAYQILDSVQTAGIGILRGYNDTRIISVICFVTYCILGLPVGFLLARTDVLAPAMGAAGFWVAYIVALGFGAACYLVRVRSLHANSWENVLQRVGR